MTLEKIKKALEEVHNMCQAEVFCNVECPFYNVEAKTFQDCLLVSIPENWELDNVDITERGKQ